ncbi:MAG: ATP-binding protein [Atopobiaceae bacterium]|nr:ATP-binding protein [Atopobiaceae bacterium]
MAANYTLKRKLYDQLLDWKHNACGKSAVMVEGARRVGKSTVVEAFAQTEYEDYLLLDFTMETPEVLDNFRYVGNLDMFFRNLFLLKGKELPKHRSVIIFDEVQLFPLARQAIKPLVADGRYDYIETGSLISIKKNVSKILIPSEEHKLKMYPMDFEEFLWATDNTVTAPAIRDAFEARTPLGDNIHRRFMQDFRAYLAVGGMPQAVAAYAAGESYQQIERTKDEILSLYEDDLEKFDDEEGARASAVFRSIPSQLSHHNARFRYAAVGRNARATNIASALDFLRKSMMANLCTNVTSPEVALDLYEDMSSFKLFVGDTGLLLSQIMRASPDDGQELQRLLVAGRLGVNLGMIMENAVAQALVASGHQLHFHTFEAARDGKPIPHEVDFLVVRGRRLCPLEVKSSGYRRHASLDQFIKRYNVGGAESYILTPKDLSREGNVTYIPLYMSMCL